ncbi:DNA translocase FtsK [Brevibacillus nitrificans]|uniref:DNA translocase FtsK n=1 Tax=Brevibacillus nitrificans TaxID=651560 RepID=UPI002864F93E|nr:DNA translocase FtsK [Brevibacillus nitrificans]MDR7318899.1 putative ArsR family transcriptional regulator [Brevibacillus nitrificans]
MSASELPSYDRVKAYVIHLGKHDSSISIIAISRHFKITNVEAARFVSQLEEEGVISRLVGGVGRRLLIKEGQS